MKILHTSDWHLGRHFYRYDREEEHENFISQLRTIVAREQPDALIISGDIYDSPAPTVSAQNLFVNSILTLRAACEHTAIVITAGNHDSGNRLDVHRSLWNLAGVKVVGGCHRNEDGTFNPEEFIVRIADRGIIAAVPYFHPNNYPQATADTAREERQQAFFKKVMTCATGYNTNNQPIVLTAHLAVEGCNIHGHEDDMVGNMEKESLQQLYGGYDYLALGHIHKPQNINERVRYSGSPIPLSFNEDYVHTVSRVELPAHGIVPVITEYEIHPLRQVKTLFEKDLDSALDMLARWDNNDPSYIRVIVEQEGILPADAENRAIKQLSDKSCRFCEIRKALKHTDHSSMENNPEISPDMMKTVSPLTIANNYCEKKEGAKLSEELEKLLIDVINEVNAQQK